MNFTARYKAFLAQPFSEDMDATSWFLFIGFLICIIIAWNLVLRHLFME